MASAAVLFDFDGVVIESRRAITGCLNQALTDNGYAARPLAELVPMIGPPLAAAFAELTNEARDSTPVARLVASYRHHYATASLRDTELIPGIKDALRDLEQDWPLALATSKSSAFVRPLLNHFDIEDIFTVVCAPAMTTVHESKGETIRRALAELGRPAAAVMIGDRSHDVVGAEENGIASIGVMWGIGTVNELTSAGASAIIDDPAQLVGAISAALNL